MAVPVPTLGEALAEGVEGSTHLLHSRCVAVTIQLWTWEDEMGKEDFDVFSLEYFILFEI